MLGLSMKEEYRQLDIRHRMSFDYFRNIEIYIAIDMIVSSEDRSVSRFR
jgi:hypothetical protein